MQTVIPDQLSSDECFSPPLTLYVMNAGDPVCCTHSQVHRHNFFEVAWLPKGQLTFYRDFKSYDLKDSALMFIAPGQIHNWTYHSPETEVLSFSFAAHVFSAHGQDLRAATGKLPFYEAEVPPILQIPAKYADTLTYLYQTALDRLQLPSGLRDPLLLSYLNVILTEASHMVESKPESAPLSAAVQLTYEFRAALERHFADRKQVQEYAELLGVTTNHFVETVRQTTGYTPGQLIQERLLLEAKRLLVYTALSTAEIAYRLSFKSPSQFGYWFKEREACSPGAFRKAFSIP